MEAEAPEDPNEVVDGAPGGELVAPVSKACSCIQSFKRMAN